MTWPASAGVFAPGFSPWRDDSGVLQLRIAQLVSDGFRAGQGGLGRGFVVPRLCGGGSGAQGTPRKEFEVCGLKLGQIGKWLGYSDYPQRVPRSAATTFLLR